MNDALRELYQEMVLDHGRRPRNFGAPENCSHCQEGYNPVCGDRIKVYLQIVDDTIHAVHFDGEGCAISVASASIMTQMLTGQSIQAAEKLFQHFHAAITADMEDVTDTDMLGKLKVLLGVKAFPNRVKCATLAWHAMQHALKDNDITATTE